MTAESKKSPARASKQPQDTIGGCRSRAEADALASTDTSTDNARIRLETSAASWAARADMLQRLDDAHEARLTKVARAGEDGDDSAPDGQ